MSIGMGNTFEQYGDLAEVEVTPENIGNPEIKNKLIEYFKDSKPMYYEIIKIIEEVSQLTRVYLSGGNGENNEYYSYCLMADHTIDVGGTNRNGEYPSALFLEHSELDRHEMGVSIIFYTEDGYDIDEDGIAEFKYNEISNIPFEDYPETSYWKKEYIGTDVANFVPNINIIENKIIVKSKKTEEEYTIENLIYNWDAFAEKYCDNIFNITQLFKLYNEIVIYTENNELELNDDLKYIMKQKHKFEKDVGVKDTDKGKLFVSLDNFDVLYTKNPKNQIVPTKKVSGTSFSVEFAINKDFEEGLLTGNN